MINRHCVKQQYLQKRLKVGMRNITVIYVLLISNRLGILLLYVQVYANGFDS